MAISYNKFEKLMNEIKEKQEKIKQLAGQEFFAFFMEIKLKYICKYYVDKYNEMIVMFCDLIEKDLFKLACIYCSDISKIRETVFNTIINITKHKVGESIKKSVMK